MIFRALPFLLAASCCFAADPTPAPAAKKPLEVKMEMRDGLRFDPPRFAAQPGQEIIVTLENADTTHQQHNFVVVQPGKLKEIVQQSMELGEKGPKQGFIPENESIIIHSEVLDPEKETKVRFTLPAAPGVYPFVCSMPGHGVMMYGAIYAGEKMPALAKDPNVPPNIAQHTTPGGGSRPYVQRIFMPGAGPAAIAVALPGGDNYCWDAGECRLRYIWHGDFIDAGANWKGNGKDLPVLPAEPWWQAPKAAFPLRINGQSGPVKFLGYTINAGFPEFHFRIGQTEVFETVMAEPNEIAVHYRARSKESSLEFQIPKGAYPSQTATVDKQGDFTVHIARPTSVSTAPARL